MKDCGLVSIITPSYNCSNYIIPTIKSVLAQTYQNWELLITDDCSTDNSCEVIESFVNKDNRIRLFRLPENRGAGEARNNSIKEAKGRWIAFLDGDDMWLPQKLENQLLFMIANHIELSMCRSVDITPNGDVVGVDMGRKKILYWQNFILNNLDTSAVMYDSARIGKFYMNKIRKRQDWLLWNSILKVTRSAYCLPEFLAIYVVHDNSISSKKSGLLKYHTMVYMEQGIPRFFAVILNYLISLPLFMCKKLYHRMVFNYYKKKLNDFSKTYDYILR